MIQVILELRQYQNSTQQGLCSILGSQIPHSTANKNQGSLTNARALGGKDRFEERLTCIEPENWMGTLPLETSEY